MIGFLFAILIIWAAVVFVKLALTLAGVALEVLLLPFRAAWAFWHGYHDDAQFRRR